MTENYEPQLSNWIVGKVLNWCEESKDVGLSILAGQVTKAPKGKFDLGEDETNEDENGETIENFELDVENSESNETNSNLPNICSLNYNSFVSPRLLLLE